MTMDSEAFEGLFDAYDSSDYAERSRRPWGRSVPTPNQNSSMPRRPTGNAVTEGQLNAAVDRLDGKINTLSNGVKALEGRTNTIANEQDRLGTALRKEIEERKKGLEAAQKDLNNTKMVSLLLPFLTQRPVPVTTTSGETTQVLTQPSDSLSTLLPFLLLMGSGSSGSSGSGMFGDNSSMLLFAVMLSRR